MKDNKMKDNKMKTIKTFTIFLTGAILVFSGLAKGTAEPQLSVSQLKTIAQSYSRNINAPMHQFDVAFDYQAKQKICKIEFHQADAKPDDLNNHNILSLISNRPSPFWEINNGNDSKLDIDDLSGNVLGYIKLSDGSKTDTQPAGEAIPQSVALRLAEAAIKATGNPLNKFTLGEINEEQENIPYTSGGHIWDVIWQRTYQGILYRREQARVVLSAETGDVISVGMYVQSIDPVSVTENISQAQAQSIAEAQISAAGLPFSDLPQREIKKEIVPLNNYWQSGDEAHHTRQTRVVWNCTFGVPEYEYEVWVDTETGDVVGGYYTGTLGGKAKRLSPKFGHQLKHSEIAVSSK